jgi:integrase/recombinase XerD
VDIQFVRTFNYVLWNDGAKAWFIPHYKRNLEVLKEYFGERLVSVEYVSTLDVGESLSRRCSIDRDTLLVVRTRSGRLRVICGYNEYVANSIKTIPFARWDPKNKWWTVPASDGILQQLRAAAYG